MWACFGPGQLPHMGQFCACSLPCMCLLIAIAVPVDCHTGASCLPHRCLVSDTCGPHVGQTTATCGPHVGQRCKTRVAHMCALGGSNFNCHMWALCGPLVECLLGRVVRLAKNLRWVPTGYYLDWWVSVTGYGSVGVSKLLGSITTPTLVSP